MDELNENYLNTTYDKFFDIDRKVLAKLKQEDGDVKDNEREHQFLSKITKKESTGSLLNVGRNTEKFVYFSIFRDPISGKQNK